MAGIFNLQVSRLFIFRQPDNQLPWLGDHLDPLAGGESQRSQPTALEGELRERVGPAAVGAVAGNALAGLGCGGF